MDPQPPPTTAAPGDDARVDEASQDDEQVSTEGADVGHAEIAAPPPPKRREICARCKRPSRVCLCPALPPSPIHVPRLRIIVLEHNEEAKTNMAKRTVPILLHCIDDIVVIRGRRFFRGEHARLDEALADPHTLLLFPTKAAVDVRDVPMLAHQHKQPDSAKRPRMMGSSAAVTDGAGEGAHVQGSGDGCGVVGDGDYGAGMTGGDGICVGGGGGGAGGESKRAGSMQEDREEASPYRTLVVPDATWVTARHMYSKSQCLHGLTSITLPSYDHMCVPHTPSDTPADTHTPAPSGTWIDTPPLFTIRKEPPELMGRGRSTAEAVAGVLALLPDCQPEGKEIAAKIMTAVAYANQLQVSCANKSTIRHRPERKGYVPGLYHQLSTPGEGNTGACADTECRPSGPVECSEQGVCGDVDARDSCAVGQPCNSDGV